MALSTTFSVPRGFLAVPAHQDSHFASAAEQLHGHKLLQARPPRVSIISSACFITQAQFSWLVCARASVQLWWLI